MASESITVLVVEDERDLADLYTSWLNDRYDIRTAYDGGSALTLIDAGIDVDIALLDRRMPDMTGDEVLEVIRDRGLDCQVAMVTAVEPDFDVVEMGFDDYIVKPVPQSDLIELVEQLTNLTEYDDYIQRYYQLASKKATLEENKSKQELRESEEYADLIEEFKRVQSQANKMFNDKLEEEPFKNL